LRFLAGLGLGGVWVVTVYVSEAWPQHQRARAVAFVLSSFPVGAGLGSAIAAWILPGFGWRVLFLACGVSTLIPIAYVYFLCPESPEWLAQRTTGSGSDRPHRSEVMGIFSQRLRQRTILATTAASFALIAYWGVMSWLPAFLVQNRGLSVPVMAMFMVLLNVGMFIGYNVLGYAADHIGKKRAIILSLCGTALTLPLYGVFSSHTLLLWLGPVYAFFMAFAGLFGSYVTELFPTPVRTTGSSFCFNVGRGVSAFAPFVLGWIAKDYGLATGISLCAGFYLLAALTISVIPQKKPTERGIGHDEQINDDQTGIPRDTGAGKGLDHTGIPRDTGAGKGLDQTGIPRDTGAGKGLDQTGIPRGTGAGKGLVRSGDVLESGRVHESGRCLNTGKALAPGDLRSAGDERSSVDGCRIVERGVVQHRFG
jgi:predicted MFS family arabinose efflux permease